jgi:hypothetical protein
MTDLTPEQVEQWADNKEMAWHYKNRVETALHAASRGAATTVARCFLHAHAKMLQQQAENAEKQATIERLRDLIQDWYDYGYERNEAEKILQALQGEGE